MRKVLFLFLIAMFPVCSVWNLPAFAQSKAEVPLAAPPEDKKSTVEGDDLEKLAEKQDETLASLFEDLKRESKPAAAQRISKRIWARWTDSGSDSINLLMDRASMMMQSKKTGAALDILDQVVTLAPDYVEGWNRRATVYFANKDLGLSLADIERVLALEPRHFGALSGLALILETLGKDQKARDTWYKVLALYPANSSAQTAIIKLEEKLAGNRT